MIRNSRYEERIVEIVEGIWKSVQTLVKVWGALDLIVLFIRYTPKNLTKKVHHNDEPR
jgi:hypothetical protein